MNRFKLLAISSGAGLACALMASTGALADVVVDVWAYNGSSLGTNASVTTAAALPATPTYEFTYSSLNDIQWNNLNNQGGSNTGLDFFGAAGIGHIGTFTIGTLAAFESQVLSVPLDAQTAFFKITGTLTGTILSGSQITHDDGATFTVGSDTFVSSPGETSAATNTFGAGQTYNAAPFTLFYVEGNGAPAELDVRVNGANLTTDVPEPSTWAMMILGFCGVGFLAYRRKSNPAFRLA
jgi:hypothetical protein